MQISFGFTRNFWHFFAFAIVKLFSLIIMRCYLQQPRVLYFYDLSHELFSGENEFVVNKPAWVVLEQGAVRVYHDSLVMFHSPVLSSLVWSYCVIEKTCRDRLQIKRRNV